MKDPRQMDPQRLAELKALRDKIRNADEVPSRVTQLLDHIEYLEDQNKTLFVVEGNNGEIYDSRSEWVPFIGTTLSSAVEFCDSQRMVVRTKEKVFTFKKDQPDEFYTEWTYRGEKHGGWDKDGHGAVYHLTIKEVPVNTDFVDFYRFKDILLEDEDDSS